MSSKIGITMNTSEAEAESVKLVPTMEGARFHEGQVVKYAAKNGYIR